jgi:hypothetical protein
MIRLRSRIPFLRSSLRIPFSHPLNVLPFSLLKQRKGGKSAVERKAQSEKMKKIWAVRKSKAKKGKAAKTKPAKTKAVVKSD